MRSVYRLVDVVGKLWAAPNTIFGLIAGALGVPFGARLSVQHNALVFLQYPFGPGGAITLGNIIISTESSLDIVVMSYEARCGLCAPEWVHLGKHEEAHTYQYQLLGPLFGVAYWIAGIGRVVSSFERAADRYALMGTGWRPW